MGPRRGVDSSEPKALDVPSNSMILRSLLGLDFFSLPFKGVSTLKNGTSSYKWIKNLVP